MVKNSLVLFQEIGIHESRRFAFSHESASISIPGLPIECQHVISFGMSQDSSFLCADAPRHESGEEGGNKEKNKKKERKREGPAIQSMISPTPEPYPTW